MDEDSLVISTDFSKKKSPIAKYPFYMIIETSGSNFEKDEEQVQKFLEELLEDGTVSDGVATNEPGKLRVLSLNLISIPSLMCQ